jgi:hypothetical protein
MAARIVEASPLPLEGTSGVSPQTTELRYDENGVMIPHVEAVNVPNDERDEKIKQLEKDMAVAQFKAVLPTAEGRQNASKILEQFQKGTMTYKNFHFLDRQTKRLYVQLHGTVEIPGIGAAKVTSRKVTPLSDDEKITAEKKRAKRNSRNKIAKESRRRNRK